jgi:hypothetical protein
MTVTIFIMMQVIVYAVDFASDGTGGYDITVSSSPEDTASCSGGGSGNYRIFR